MHMLTPDDLGDVLRRRAEGQTWQAIATAYGITREGARYSHRRALRLLGEAEAAQRAMVAQESPGEAPDTNGGM